MKITFYHAYWGLIISVAILYLTAVFDGLANRSTNSFLDLTSHLASPHPSNFTER